MPRAIQATCRLAAAPACAEAPVAYVLNSDISGGTTLSLLTSVPNWLS